MTPKTCSRWNGKADNCYDGFTMGLYNWDTVKAMPFAVRMEREVERTRQEYGPTAASLVHLKMMAQRKGRPRWGRQY